ncbi:MAG: tRNA lysidine(34) synthetase TilS [Thalassospira sp.]|uniref:tRNA lysidine(34) synthetase TilS n=1 Tax=Thalassospira sp. TaxID=1912094 RepID=UPI0032EE2C9C
MTDRVRSQQSHSAASSGTPLDAVVFERLMTPFLPFEKNPKLAVGVSGGADSMALTLLAHDWCRNRGGVLLAVTVDHGLRGDSASEAKKVGDQLAKHGIDHVIAPWVGDKPAGAIQEQARIARYHILDNILRDRGIFHLLIAHHADDQAETIAMRDARGTKVLGLSGMTARRFLRHGRMLRPLLPVSKADLMATLAAFDQEWIEDPSNTNEKFERVRVRNDLSRGIGENQRDQSASDHRIALETSIGEILASSVTLYGSGIAMIARDAFFAYANNNGADIYALGQVVRTVGGAAYMPGFDALRDALAQFSRDKTARISLGGCMLHGRKGQICIYRELGRMDRVAVPVSFENRDFEDGIRWDNRFDLMPDDPEILPEAGLMIGPIDLCDVFHTKAFRSALREIVPFIGNLPRAALASMPALYDKEGLRSVGGLEVSELSDVLSAADCERPLGRGEFAFGGRWRFAPRVPLWESGFKSSPKPDNLLA